MILGTEAQSANEKSAREKSARRPIAQPAEAAKAGHFPPSEGQATGFCAAPPRLKPRCRSAKALSQKVESAKGVPRRQHG